MTNATNDPFNLERFLAAQAQTYDRALSELKNGSKRTHWMWFVFPQVVGLGESPTSRLYAITSREEASAYWSHPTLGARLRECCEAILMHTERSARSVLGRPDDMKLRSSATLFAHVTNDPIFKRVLGQFFDGKPDESTLAILQSDQFLVK